MPITTYCEGFPYATKHKVIRELLNELNQIDGERWECEEREITTGFFFKKTHKGYTLYSHVGDGIEYQVINFYRDKELSSINYWNTAELVVAYLYGYLGGLKKQ